MKKWLVRWQNQALETISFEVYADCACDAWSAACSKFDALPKEQTAGFELNGVFEYMGAGGVVI